jgi:hypothetical protein
LGGRTSVRTRSDRVAREQPQQTNALAAETDRFAKKWTDRLRDAGEDLQGRRLLSDVLRHTP